MMNYFNYVSANTLPITNGAASSFVCYGGMYESLIDLVLLPAERADAIVYCKILDDHVLNVSRHRPILCSIKISETYFKTSEIQTHITWHKIDNTILHRYETELNECF